MSSFQQLARQWVVLAFGAWHNLDNVIVPLRAERCACKLHRACDLTPVPVCVPVRVAVGCGCGAVRVLVTSGRMRCIYLNILFEDDN